MYADANNNGRTNAGTGGHRLSFFFSYTPSYTHPLHPFLPIPPLPATMRLSAARILPFLSLSVIPFSRASYNHRHRQLVVSSSGAASSGPTTSVASATSAASTSSGASVVSGSSISRTSAAVNTSLPTPSFSLVSENPTAVPISSIIANASSAPVPPQPTPFAAGTKPSDIPNAPGLPSREHFTLYSEKIT
jgi:hypothetical protein